MITLEQLFKELLQNAVNCIAIIFILILLLILTEAIFQYLANK